ncbi:capsular polysaccharide biosynthesis protein [Celeribacter neptunius]|uniref:capsular polysaccharide biosynthesis protein n=1 Tax=Celeribacter neptunius TaxID=588602 RepID=UPI0015A69E8A|nr:capsular polysaccharide biosynthesis protein [Celeribacter neptunius]
MIANDPLDMSAELDRARDAIDWLVALKLSKSATSIDANRLPNGPYVLVLDQPKSVDGAPPDTDMLEMLVFAQTELLNAQVAVLCCADGYFTSHADPRISLLPPESNLYALLESATAVYTHSAGFGADAIFAGHRPRVFGQPWYGGLGLSQDERPDPHATRRLTRAQLFHAAFMRATQWHAGETALEIEAVLARLETRERALREDASGYVASNILRWKHGFLKSYLGRGGITVTDAPEEIATEKARGRRHLVWGNDPAADLRLEDGFLRSRGLGAALVRPLSLVLDDIGIYFDPTRPSRLEQMIAERASLSPAQSRRIDTFLTRLRALNLSKYNVGTGVPPLPEGHRILVAGQVEDDASITLGAGEIASNRALLEAARAAHPQAVIVYKPHPDVEAGLRKGKLGDAEKRADVVAHEADPLALIEACDEVWTMTSLIGFEALLRDRPVTCTGAPFYAGWGLTTDLGKVPARRGAHPTLLGLAHAVLIDYPRYFDPKTGAPLSPEEALEYLSTAPQGRSRLTQALLAKLRQARAAFLGLS